MSYRLGISTLFAVNKFTEPDVLFDVVRNKLGLNYVQMTSELMDPAWPDYYAKGRLEEMKKAAIREGVTVESMMVGGKDRGGQLSSGDEGLRRYYYDWYTRFMEFGYEFGATTFGGILGTYSFAAFADEKRREEIRKAGYESWYKISKTAKKLGYKALFIETMSIPREPPYRIEESKEILKEMNQFMEVPMMLCLDVGHAPAYDQRDPYLWVEELAADACVIHVQQTVRNQSRHAAFTKANNETGIISAEKLIESTKKSGCTDTLFAFEIIHKENLDQEDLIIPELKESVDYFRDYIKE